MQLNHSHINQIRSSFFKMQSKEDLLDLLNTVKSLLYGERAIPFEIKQLTWYANPKLGRNRYREFKIKKKSGSFRTIHAPVRGLKSIQKVLSIILQCVFQPVSSVNGFVQRKSIVDNAIVHEGMRYVYNIDLKDFFTSIDQARVWKCLQLRPFNLSKESTSEIQYMKWESFIKDYPNAKYYNRPFSPLTAAFKGFTVDYLIQGQKHPFYKGKSKWFTFTNKGLVIVSTNYNKAKEGYILIRDNSSNTQLSKISQKSFLLTNHIKNNNKQEIANIIASISCTSLKVERKSITGDWETVVRNVLPQGAPTSPVLTNIVCQRLDFLLTGLSKRFGLNYSRYADDITFSSMHNIYGPQSDFLVELQRIISNQGFYIQKSKTRLQKQGYRQEVTGLIVNENTNVQKHFIKKIRMWLYYWERYGYERAYAYFLQQYEVDKGYIKKGNPNMINILKGKLDFCKMVKGEDNQTYFNLRKRFYSLLNTLPDQVNILDVWEKEGIEKAMEIYNEK